MEGLDKKGVSVSKVAIIVLLTLILLLTAAILFFVVNGNEIGGIIRVFETDGEYTMSLDEFIVNLKPEGNLRHYLKISMALMYTDEDQGSVIESNINKIRDTVISNIRSRTYSDILEDPAALDFKEDVKTSINDTLELDIIKEIYITDIVVQ